MLKHFLVVLGFISLLLGIIGILLPVMPTIPFLFLSYICFSKGSDRFREWYLDSTFHKKYLKAHHVYKSVPLIYKILYVVGVISFILAVVIVSILFYEKIVDFILKVIM